MVHLLKNVIIYERAILKKLTLIKNVPIYEEVFFIECRHDRHSMKGISFNTSTIRDSFVLSSAIFIINSCFIFSPPFSFLSGLFAYSLFLSLFYSYFLIFHERRR